MQQQVLCPSDNCFIKNENAKHTNGSTTTTKNPFPIWTFILFSFPIFLNFWTIWITNYITMILSNCITMMQNDTILSNCIKTSFSQIRFQFYFNFFHFFFILSKSHFEFLPFFSITTIYMYNILIKISFIFSSSKLES